MFFWALEICKKKADKVCFHGAYLLAGGTHIKNKQMNNLEKYSAGMSAMQRTECHKVEEISKTIEGF